MKPAKIIVLMTFSAAVVAVGILMARGKEHPFTQGVHDWYDACQHLILSGKRVRISAQLV